MDSLTARLDSARRALATFQEILEEPFSVIVGDASIQRFEYTFESAYKLLRAYLHDVEKVRCGSPRACFRAAVAANLLTLAEGEAWLLMTDDRNRTSHAYLESVAREIYQKLPDYRDLVARLVTAIEGGMP